MNASHANPGGTATLAGRTVSRIGYGAMQLEKLHHDPDAGVALLRRAFELGVDHVDTAEFYGDGFVNSLVRRAVADRDDIVVATKVGADPDRIGPIPLKPAQRPDEIRASVHANLASLGVDRLDLVNLRRLDVGPGISATGDQVVDIADQLEVLVELRDVGKIAAIGLSSVTIDGLRTALPAGIACVQNSYSLVNRDFDDLLALCIAADVAWVPFFPLGGAFPGVPKVTDEPLVIEAARRLGATPSQVGLAWLLQHAPNTLLIPGTATISHLEENVAAGDLHLDAATKATLDAVTSKLASGPMLAD